MITDRGFSFTLPPGGMVETVFYGGSNTQFGTAIVNFCAANSACSSAGLYAEVDLKNRNSTRPDFESVFPLEQPAAQQDMVWDHRNGFTTVLYLVNTSTTVSTVTLNFVNQVNQTIALETVSMQPLESQILTLHVLAPVTIGREGTLQITARGPSGAAAPIVATALRINPSNSFTPLRAYVPSH
jgi:hypothetical protein